MEIRIPRSLVSLLRLLVSSVVLPLCLVNPAAASGPRGVDPSVERSAAVSLQGIDLSTPEGIQAAREAIHQTARKLCRRVADELDLSHHDNYLVCVDDAVAAAFTNLQTSVAASAATTRISKVSLADLNLATAEGRRLAFERLRAEAGRLCRQESVSSELSHQAKYLDCIEESLSQAKNQVTPGSTAARLTSQLGSRR